MLQNFLSLVLEKIGNNVTVVRDTTTDFGTSLFHPHSFKMSFGNTLPLIKRIKCMFYPASVIML